MRKILLLLNLCCLGFGAFAQSTLSGGGNSAATICAPASSVILDSFTIGQSSGDSLKTVTFTASGTFVSGDVLNFKLHKNTTTNFSGATVISTISTVTAAGTYKFSQVDSLHSDTVHYWITADIAAIVGAGDTVQAKAVTVTTGSGILGSIADGGKMALNNTPASITGGSSVCPGSSLPLADATTGGTWSSSNSLATITTGGVVTGSASGTDTITYAKGGCKATLTFTVNQTPVITGSTTVCSGVTITLSTTSTGGTWGASNNFATITAGGILRGDTANKIDTISYTSSFGCKGYYFDTINQTPKVNHIANDTVCTGTTISSVTFSGTPATGVTYTWTANANNINLTTTGGTATVPSFTATYSAGAYVTDTFYVTPSTITCPGAMDSFLVTVYSATPTVSTITGKKVCNNIADSFIVTGTGTKYTWVQDSSMKGNITSGSAYGSGVLFRDTLNNRGLTDSVTRFTIIAHLGNCAGTPVSFYDTVHATPNAARLYTSAQISCDSTNYASSLAIMFTGSSSNTHYNWTSNGIAVRGLTSGIDSITAFQVVNLGAFDSSLIIIDTPKISGCLGTVVYDTIIVHPYPSSFNLSGTVYCNDTVNVKTMMFTSDSAYSYPYTWTKTNDSLSNGNISSGVSNFTFKSVNAGTTDVYDTVVVTAGFGCNGVTNPSSTIIDTIHPTPMMNPFTSSSNILCSRTFVDTIFFSGATSALNTYSWTNTNSSIGIAAAGTTAFIPSFFAMNTVTTIDTAYAYVTVTPMIGSCSGSPLKDTFAVRLLPIASGLSNPYTICAGAGTTIDSIKFTVPTGTTISWTNDSSYMFLPIAGHPFYFGSGSTNFLDKFSAVNTDYVNFRTDTFNISTSLNGCSFDSSYVISFTPQVSMNPVGNYLTDSGLLYHPGTIFSSVYPTTRYMWTNSDSSITSGLRSAGWDSLGTFTAMPHGTDTAKFTVTPYIGTCAATTSTTFDIVVRPIPPVMVSLYNDTLCSGSVRDSAMFSVSSLVTGSWISFKWYNLDTAIAHDSLQFVFNTLDSGSVIGAAGVISLKGLDTFTVINKTNFFQTDSIIVYATIHNSATDSVSCAPRTLRFTVAPVPNVTHITDTAFCNNAANHDTLRFNGKTPSTYYSWTSSSNISAAFAPTSGIDSIPFVPINTTDSLDSVKIVVTPKINISSGACGMLSDSFHIVINPTPNIKHVTAFICDSTALVDSVTTPTQGIVNSWAWARLANANIRPTTLTTGGTYHINETYLKNATSLGIDSDVTVSYTVTLKMNGGCTGTATIKDTVYPIPYLMNHLAMAICDSSHLYDTIKAVPSVMDTITWSRPAHWGINNSNASAGPNAIIDMWLKNSTDSTQTVYFYDSLKYKSCATKYVYKDSIMVRPTPRLLVTKDTICSDNKMNFALQSSVKDGSTAHSWTVAIQNNVNTNPLFDTTNTIKNFVTSNSKDVYGSLIIADVLKITDYGTAKCSANDTVTVYVQPRPAPLKIKEIFGDTLRVCVGMMYQTFMATSSTIDYAQLKYSWGDSCYFDHSVNTLIKKQATSATNDSSLAVVNFTTEGTVLIYDKAWFNDASQCYVVSPALTINVATTSTPLINPTVLLYSDNQTMVCFGQTDTTVGYQWGVDKISTLASYYLTDDNGNSQVNQDIVFDSHLRIDNGVNHSTVATLADTNQYYFWVQTTQNIDGTNYVQKSYYQGSIAKLPRNTTHNNNAEINYLKLYPNPSNNNLFIELVNGGNSEVRYEIYDLLGRKVSSIVTSDEIISISVADLQAGKYFVNCIKNGTIITSSEFIKN